MGARGPESSADLAVQPQIGMAISLQRPSPLPELTSEQAEEWIGIVNRLPADWFPQETWTLLGQYCRHIVAARRIAQLIQMMEDGLIAISVNASDPAEDDEGDENAKFNLKSYDKLLQMQERESRTIASLATKMRLSQQTTYDKSKKKPVASKAPWQV